MLKVKLTRIGKRNQPHYRIVVNEAKDKRDGSYVENLGHYAPTQTPKLLEVNVERFDYWVKQGAKPTDTVAALVERYKSGNPFPPKKKKLNKKAKARLEAEKEASSTSSETKVDTPKEEAKTEEKTEAPTEEVKETDK